jgi:hypothetical protein
MGNRFPFSPRGEKAARKIRKASAGATSRRRAIASSIGFAIPLETRFARDRSSFAATILRLSIRATAGVVSVTRVKRRRRARCRQSRDSSGNHAACCVMPRLDRNDRDSLRGINRRSEMIIFGGTRGTRGRIISWSLSAALAAEELTVPPAP